MLYASVPRLSHFGEFWTRMPRLHKVLQRVSSEQVIYLWGGFGISYELETAMH